MLAWYVIHLKKESTFNRLYKTNPLSKIHCRKESKTKEEEYSIAKAAKIAPSDVEFPYNKAVASQVSTVEDFLSASLYDKVDIKLKVVTKSENKQPVVHREKTKYRVECLVTQNQSN